MEEIIMEGIKVPIDEIVDVQVSRDGMLGVIQFFEPKNGGRILTMNEVLQAIMQDGIIYGLKKEVIKELVQDKQYRFKYIIAQGTYAEDGTDAVIQLQFDAEKLKKLCPKEKDDGTVDFKELDSIRNVKKGEILASKIPATDGRDGMNVLGKPLRARKGKDKRLPAGKNTTISGDGLNLIAAEEGKLEYDEQLISVSTVYVIENDVDNTTGNIDFVGSVIVNGSVHDGFKVQAKGSIEVRGAVEGATLIAGGDIILAYGIQGNDTSHLKAGGNIIAKFIQNANIEAEGSVIAEGIWNSTVNAGATVKVDIGKGSIMGGNIIAANIVAARNIGSPMGVITGIQTGIQPYVFTEYKALANAIGHEQEELNNIEKEIIYMKTRNMGEKADHVRHVRLQKLMASRKQLMDQLLEDKSRYRRLANRVEHAVDGEIKVSGRIYPGTKMIIGNATKEITVETSKCAFRKVGADIHIGDYDEVFTEVSDAALGKSVKEVEDGLYIEEIGTLRYKKK